MQKSIYVGGDALRLWAVFSMPDQSEAALDVSLDAGDSEALKQLLCDPNVFGEEAAGWRFIVSRGRSEVLKAVEAFLSTHKGALFSGWRIW